MAIDVKAGQTRLFADLDVGQSKFKGGKADAAGAKGISAIDIEAMGKKHPVKAFFAALFGTQINVDGKQYIIGTKSAKAFLERNHVQVGKADSKALVTALKGYYSETGTRAKLAFHEGKDQITMPWAQFDKALKDMGIKDTSSLKEKLGKNGSIDISRDKMLTALKDIKDQIQPKKGSEFEFFAVTLKKAIDSHKVPDNVDDGIFGTEELPKEEPRTELRGVNVRDRMKDAIGLGMAAGVKDKAGAQEFLNKLDQDLKEDKFHANNAGDLKLVLQNHRGTMDVDSKHEFDRIIKFVGFTVKGDQIQEPAKK